MTWTPRSRQKPPTADELTQKFNERFIKVNVFILFDQYDVIDNNYYNNNNNNMIIYFW